VGSAIAWQWWRYVRRPTTSVMRYLIAYLWFAGMIVATCVLAYLVFRLVQGDSVGDILGFGKRFQISEGSRSSLARLDQIIAALPVIEKSPLLGHGIGVGGFVLDWRGAGNLRTVDNYFLLMVLDSGLVTLVIYLCFYGWLVKNMLAVTTSGSDDDPYLEFALLFSVLTMFMSELIHALPDLRSLQFALIGVFLARRTLMSSTSAQSGGGAERERRVQEA